MYIRVDHSKLESTAAAIDEYVKCLKEKMRYSQNEVSNLSAAWQGSDFAQFRNKFDEVDNNDSTHVQMINALESYAKYLRYAVNKYKQMQTRAVNRANALPRW